MWRGLIDLAPMLDGLERAKWRLGQANKRRVGDHCYDTRLGMAFAYSANGRASLLSGSYRMFT
jgi:hypothetical protein